MATTTFIHIPAWLTAFLGYVLISAIIVPLQIALMGAAVLTLITPQGGLPAALAVIPIGFGVIASKNFLPFFFLAFIMGPIAGIVSTTGWKKVLGIASQKEPILQRLSIELVVINVGIVLSIVISLLLMLLIHPYFIVLIPLMGLYGLYRLLTTAQDQSDWFHRVVATLFTAGVWGVVSMIITILMGLSALPFIKGF